MPNIEFLGFSWNPFVFWWVLSLLAMSILGLAGLRLNDAVREAEEKKVPKGAPKGGVDVRDAQVALYATIWTIPLACATMFTFAVPVVIQGFFWRTICAGILYGFFRECWRRASETDWRAKYPSSRLAVAGRILLDSVSCFTTLVTVGLFAQFVFPH